MKTSRVFTLFLLLANVLPIGRSAGAATDVPDPVVIEQENLIRREAEQKIQDEILDRILGEGRATVLVNVEITLESQRRDSATSEGKVEDRKGLGEQDFILPWVPAPKSVNKASEVPKDAKVESASGELATAAVRQTVNRFDVTVIHDDSVSKSQLGLVEEAVRSAYVRFEKVLRVIFKPTKFARYEMGAKIKEGFWDFLKPQYLLPGVIALLLLLFLFGPLLAFLQSLLKAMTARREMFQEMRQTLDGKNKEELDEESKSESENEGALGEDALAAKQLEEEMQKFVPFSYIDEKNLQRLIYLISREPPETIAIIVSYLKPEFVKLLLAPLSPERQAKIAMHMAIVKQTSEAEVRALDKEIKDKIDYVVGGLNSLVKVLNDVDAKIRDNILEYLKDQRPQLYEKIRRFILTFSDLPSISDQAFQIVVRELRAENLAKALRNASPEITEKFFKNISKGAAALLKEEMEYSRQVTPDQIEGERQKIMEVIKRLEDEGRVVVREKIADDYLDLDDLQFISGIQSSLSRPQTPLEPVDVQDYVRAASQLFEARNYGDAVAYFKEAAKLDPSSSEIQQFLGNCYYALGQAQDALAAFEQALALNPGNEDLRRWVEEFRATLPAATQT